MAHTPFIGANLKMNPLPSDLAAYREIEGVDVVIFPTNLDLRSCIDAKLVTGAQCSRPEEKGAFTGDLSVTMLKGLGVTHILAGHSDRRAHHSELDDFVAKQVKTIIEHELTAVLCIGESEAERDAGKTNEVLIRQLKTVSECCPLTAAHFVLAYEPIWAIGTGKTPTVHEIQETHAFLRSLLPDPTIRIMYGGSVKAENAKEIFACEGVDGGLIGGASLDPAGFKMIVEAARKK